MDRSSVFRIIGLTDNEATVYLALLHRVKYGTAYQVAAITGLKPSTVHDNLRSLTRKRLVSRKQVRRHKQKVSQFYIKDRDAVVKKIQKEALRQLSRSTSQ